MADLTAFDPNSAGNPNNNIFGLPFSEEEARLVILPIPWEVTVSYKAGTARVTERICQASLQVDLFDDDNPEAWKQVIFLLDPDKNILMKSDYLRKEAELYINYITEGEQLSNSLVCSYTQLFKNSLPSLISRSTFCMNLLSHSSSPSVM